MFLSGFHGTDMASALSIMRDGCFHPSTGPRQWLGDGIYFFYNVEDALAWKGTSGGNRSDAVLHAVVSIPDDAFFDLNTDEGMHMMTQLYDSASKKLGSTSKEPDAQGMQSNVAQMIWNASPNLRVLSGTFPTEPRTRRLIIDTRTFRNEFCVRDCRDENASTNASIRTLRLLTRDQLEGVDRRITWMPGSEEDQHV